MSGFSTVDAVKFMRFNSDASSSLVESIDNIIDSTIRSKCGIVKHKAFAPSSFQCARAMWFRLRGTETDEIDIPDRILEFKANLGTEIHKIFQKYISEALKDNWISVQHFLELNPIDWDYTLSENGFETFVETISPFPIRFACDGILKIDESYYLLEIKTCESSTFLNLDEPRSHHIDQVMCYSTILGLSNVLFLYVDRSYGDIKCYEISVKPSDNERVLSRFKEVTDCAEYGLPPARLPSGSSMCSSSMCPYFKKCKEW